MNINQTICALGVLASVNILGDAIMGSHWWIAFAMTLNIAMFTFVAFDSETRR